MTETKDKTGAALDLAIEWLEDISKNYTAAKHAADLALKEVHAILNPAPIMEEVEEVVGWVNVYQRADGNLRRGVPKDDKDAALREIGPAPLEKYVDTVPIKVTVMREKKVPVERSVDIRLSKFGELVELSANGRDIDIREAYGKSGVFAWTEEPTT